MYFIFSYLTLCHFYKIKNQFFQYIYFTFFPQTGSYDELLSTDGPFANFLKNCLMDGDFEVDDPEIRQVLTEMWKTVDSLTSDGGISMDEEERPRPRKRLRRRKNLDDLLSHNSRCLVYLYLSK